jgi:hypothetical protein
MEAGPTLVEVDLTGVLAHQRGGRPLAAKRTTRKETRLRWMDSSKMMRWMPRLIMGLERKKHCFVYDMLRKYWMHGVDRVGIYGLRFTPFEAGTLWISMVYGRLRYHC